MRHVRDTLYPTLSLGFDARPADQQSRSSAHVIIRLHTGAVTDIFCSSQPCRIRANFLQCRSPVALRKLLTESVSDDLPILPPSSEKHQPQATVRQTCRMAIGLMARGLLNEQTAFG